MIFSVAAKLVIAGSVALGVGFLAEGSLVLPRQYASLDSSLSLVGNGRLGSNELGINESTVDYIHLGSILDPEKIRSCWLPVSYIFGL